MALPTKEVVLARLRKISERWPVFANTSAAGQYDPFSQIVTLSSIETIELDMFAKEPASPQNRTAATVIAHEVTHWLDHLTTLWGRRHLARTYDAINRRMNGEEHEFERIATDHASMRGLVFPAYYTEKGATDSGAPWTWNLTSGHCFDLRGKPRQDRPIVFTRFESGGQLVVRVPFSVASLTESAATAAELCVDARLSSDADEQDVRKWRSEHQARIYDRDFALYTVAAHLIANLLGLISDNYFCRSTTTTFAGSSRPDGV